MESPLTARRTIAISANGENLSSALPSGISLLIAWKSRTASPPTQMAAATTWATPAVRASAWSPSPAPCPASEGNETAISARITPAALTSVVAVMKPPRAMTEATKNTTINARVDGTSVA